MTPISGSDDLAAFLADPDALLFRRTESDDLLAHLNFFTVPLWFFEGRVDPVTAPRGEIRTSGGSGVLVRIGSHHFILSAGHCVKDFRSRTCAIGLRRESHRFIPDGWDHAEFVFDEASQTDYGYIHVPPGEEGTFTAAGRLFLGMKHIKVHTRDQLFNANDWMAISGYPAAFGEKTARGQGTRLVVFRSVIAGTARVPKNTAAPPKSLEYTDLWVPQSPSGIDPAQDYAPVDLPSLSGMSGGGCWKTNVRPDPSKWKLDCVDLTGIHIATTYNETGDMFGREALLGHHLSLIATTFPELKSTILSEWPQMEDARWSIKS
jgi:hypothetical protein